MKIILCSVFILTFGCGAMIQDLHKAIGKNNPHKVHALIKQVQQSNALPLPARNVSRDINLGGIEAQAQTVDPQTLLSVAQEAEAIAQSNAGTYGNVGTVLRTVAGVCLIGYGGLELAINMGYVHDSNTSTSQSAAGGTVNSTTCLGFVAAGAYQLYLAATKSDAVTNQKNAALVTHLIQNPGAAPSPANNVPTLD